jgi:hypothetical protein
MSINCPCCGHPAGWGAEGGAAHGSWKEDGHGIAKEGLLKASPWTNMNRHLAPTLPLLKKQVVLHEKEPGR